MHVPRVVHACTFWGTRLYRNGLILTPSALRIAARNSFVKLKLQASQPTLLSRWPSINS